MKLTEKFVQFISSLFFMMFLGIGIIHTEKCWPNSPTYRGWGRAQITVDILGREAKKVEKHCSTPTVVTLIHHNKGRNRWSHRYKYLYDGCHMGHEALEYYAKQLVKSLKIDIKESDSDGND